VALAAGAVALAAGAVALAAGAVALAAGAVALAAGAGMLLTTVPALGLGLLAAPALVALRAKPPRDLRLQWAGAASSLGADLG
jgi:X-X-X-Leu-X-X-Gly heptad repeat protein